MTLFLQKFLKMPAKHSWVVSRTHTHINKDFRLLQCHELIDDYKLKPLKSM